MTDVGGDQRDVRETDAGEDAEQMDDVGPGGGGQCDGREDGEHADDEGPGGDGQRADEDGEQVNDVGPVDDNYDEYDDDSPIRNTHSDDTTKFKGYTRKSLPISKPDNNTHKPILNQTYEEDMKPGLTRQPNHLSIGGKRVVLEIKLPKRGHISRGVVKGDSRFAKSKMKVSKHVSIRNFLGMGEGGSKVSGNFDNIPKPMETHNIAGNNLRSRNEDEREIGILNDFTLTNIQPAGCDETICDGRTAGPREDEDSSVIDLCSG